MSRWKTLGVAGVLAVQAGIAFAADMPETLPPPAVTDWHPPRILELNYGWYLRGDLGYAWGELSRADSASGFASPVDNALGSAITGGIGAGMKTKWLRTDLTADYLAPMKYKGTVATPDDVTAKISAISVLFNGYLDLGTWYHVSPYLGAGAGAANVRVSGYQSTVAPPFSGGDHDQWNFSWALMSGFGFAVAPNLMIDAGYRYINFGDVKSASDSFGAMTFKNVFAHEVRLGLRWSFDDIDARR